MEALLTVQIDELAAGDRAVLRQASVLGARFTRTSLVAALGLDEGHGEAVVGRLSAFLMADGEGGVRFRHGLVREAAYQGLSFRRRRALHRHVGETLERDFGADEAIVAGQLTRHFYEAGVWDKALRYGYLAGSQARRVYANVDAAALLERAVDAGSPLAAREAGRGCACGRGARRRAQHARRARGGTRGVSHRPSARRRATRSSRRG